MTPTPTERGLHDCSSSKMAQALRENIGAYAWLEGDVLRLRTKSDSVVDAVSQVAVSIRRARDGSVEDVPLSKLSAVALPKNFPGAVHGTAVPADEASEADMVLVTDSPFDVVWAHVRESSPYFWRSSAAYDMSNRMAVVATAMELNDDVEQAKALATEVVKLGRRVSEKEPATEGSGFFFLLGSAHHKLENQAEAEAAFTRALELHGKRSELNDFAVRGATRTLGVLLAMRGSQDDDMQARRRALELLDKVQLRQDDPAHKLRIMLRNAVHRADGPAPATTNSSKSGCFIATAVYGSEIAPEVTVLRKFRDARLLRSHVGRAFVRVYYATSPTIAALLEHVSPARMVVRRLFLNPIVKFAERWLSRR